MADIFILAPTPTLRAGLRVLLAQADASWEIVGEASTLAIEGTNPESADVNARVFLLTELDQVPPVARVLAEDRSQSVVMLSNDAKVTNALRALPLKGWSIVPADASAEELRAAVLAAMQGLVTVPAQMVQQILDGRNSVEPIAQVAQPQIVELEQPLTPRELEVLERVSRGLPSKLIARELEVSESTIKFHLSSIYAKLDVASRTEAVSRAAKLGLITL